MRWLVYRPEQGTAVRTSSIEPDAGAGQLILMVSIQVLVLVLGE
jgi:hypothetical protein